MVAGTSDRVTGLLARPRLEERLDLLLDDADPTDVVLVSAPAGFGKSTLLESWATRRREEVPVAACSPGDRVTSPRALWRCLVEAVARADESLATALRSLAVPDRFGHEDFALELLDLLADHPLVLVLDDLHEVRGPGVLAELDGLLGRLPATLRVVLASRTQPPLARIHDLRLQGRLAHLRAADLAFTPAETETVCHELPEPVRQRVWEHTEGWPAMVRLTHLAVADGGEGWEFWDREQGLADHLFAETFSRQAPDVQDVLLLGSVVDPVPLDLVTRLSGRDDAGAVLDDTGHRSGLVTRATLPGDVVAWHVHPILRAYLHGELVRRDVRREQWAHVTAARWFGERGDGLAAVRHAVRSRDAIEVERTLAEHGLALVNDGRSEDLVPVLEDRTVAHCSWGWVPIVTAAALLDLGRPREAAVRLDGATPGEGLASGVARDAVAAGIRRRLGHPEAGTAEDGRPAPGQVPADVALAFCLHRGTELLRVGSLDRAEDLLARAVELAEGLGRGAALVDARTQLASVSSSRSDFHRMRERVSRALEVAEQSGWSGTARAAYGYALAGWGARQDLDEAEARRLAQWAFDVVDPTDEPSVVVAVQALRSGVEVQAEGGGPVDADLLHEAWHEDGHPSIGPDLVAYAALADAHVSRAAGRLDRLREIIGRLLDRFGDCAEARLVDVMARHGRGQAAPALAELEPLLRGDVPPVVPLTAVDARAVGARIALDLDQRYRALELTRGALEGAAATGGLRSLVDSGGPGVLALLREEQGGWGRHETLVELVLARTTSPAAAVVPLTERELAVLRELPTLRTVDEIAAVLVVSVNTVKTHLRSVYRKLGVTSRRDAVTAARRTGLL
jgi:LuxR family maltose regulon positive regulatory protein